MNGKDYKMSTLKHKLLKKRQMRAKNPCWKLSYEQIEYIENVLGFMVTPVIYNIRTRPFERVNNLNYLLRDIHYSYKHGQRRLAKKLTAKDRKLLDTHGVKYNPLKYEIHLR